MCLMKIVNNVVLYFILNTSEEEKWNFSENIPKKIVEELPKIKGIATSILLAIERKTEIKLLYF